MGGREVDDLPADIGAVGQVVNAVAGRQRGGARRVGDGAIEQDGSDRADGHVAAVAANEVDQEIPIRLDGEGVNVGEPGFLDKGRPLRFLAVPGAGGVLVGLGESLRGIDALVRIVEVVRVIDVAVVVCGAANEFGRAEGFGGLPGDGGRIFCKGVNAQPRALAVGGRLALGRLLPDGPAVALACSHVVSRQIVDEAGHRARTAAFVHRYRDKVARFFIQRDGEVLDHVTAAVLHNLGPVHDQQLAGAALGNVNALDRQVKGGLVVDGHVRVAAEQAYLARTRVGHVRIDGDVAAAGAHFLQLDASVRHIPEGCEVRVGRRAQQDQSPRARCDRLDLDTRCVGDGQRVVVLAALDHAIEVKVLRRDVDAISVEVHARHGAGRINRRAVLVADDGATRLGGFRDCNGVLDILFRRIARNPIGAGHDEVCHRLPRCQGFSAYRERCHAVDVDIAAGDDGHVLGANLRTDLDVTGAVLDLQREVAAKIGEGAENGDVWRGKRFEARVHGDRVRIERVAHRDERGHAGRRLRDGAKLGRCRAAVGRHGIEPGDRRVGRCAHAIEEQPAVARRDGDAQQLDERGRVVDDGHRRVTGRV